VFVAATARRRFFVSPACQRSQAARWLSSGKLVGGDSESRTDDNSASPGVQHDVGTPGDTFDAHLTGGGVKQREQFGGSVAHVFMRIASG
jgi:hypothetical protein